MFRIVVLCAGLLFAGSLGLRAEAARLVDLAHNQVVAQVNDDVITSMEVFRNIPPEEFQNYALTGKMNSDEIAIFLNHLGSLIERSLLVQEARLKGIEIPEDILDQECKKRWQERYDTVENFQKELRNKKMSYQDFRNEVQDDLLARAMLQSRLQFDYTISPKAMWKYYKENIREYTKLEKRKLRIILVPSQLQNGEDGLELAKSLVSRIKDKKISFEEAARKYSIGPGADEGGNYGWKDMNTGGLNKTVRSVVLKLEKGQISDVIATMEGYYIIKVDDIKSDKPTPFEKVQEDIRKQISQARYRSERRKLMEELRQRAYILKYPLNL